MDTDEARIKRGSFRWSCGETMPTKLRRPAFIRVSSVFIRGSGFGSGDRHLGEAEDAAAPEVSGAHDLDDVARWARLIGDHVDGFHALRVELAVALHSCDAELLQGPLHALQTHRVASDQAVEH